MRGSRSTDPRRYASDHIASTTGVLLPIGMRWLGRDPATMAGVFDTMLSDLMGNLIHLGLATVLLSWLV